MSKIIELALSSNGFPVSTSPNRLGFLHPTSPNLPIEQLLEVYKRDGVVWLKGFFDRDEVLALRQIYFNELAQIGLVDLSNGSYTGNTDQLSQAQQVRANFVRSQAYLAFCNSPKLISFYEAFFGAPVICNARKLVRHYLPGNAAATGAHYDLTYLRAGTSEICTSWIPLGDTTIEMGGLIYLEKSDTAGRAIEKSYVDSLPVNEREDAFKKRMGGIGWLSKDLAYVADKADSRWLVADYEAGDMLVHSPYIIHASLSNQDRQRRIRLSTDIRFQKVSDRLDERWATEWSPDDQL